MRATYVGATAAALPLPVCRALLAVRAVRADFMDRTDATDRAAPDRTEMADTDTTEPASSVPSARRRGFFCGGGEVHVWGGAGAGADGGSGGWHTHLHALLMDEMQRT